MAESAVETLKIVEISSHYQSSNEKKLQVTSSPEDTQKRELSITPSIETPEQVFPSTSSSSSSKDKIKSNSAKKFDRSNSNYSSSSCKNAKNQHFNKNQQNRIKKRKRRNSKRANNKPYTKTGFKFQRPKHNNDNGNNRLDLFTINQPQVPYNTNKFLMEDHMPELQMLGMTPTNGRTRDSSFSVDSEENYFYSLPQDEEEFLTKEFSSVYENVKCERLEGLSKQQLIQEYLQLEAQLEQANRRINGRDDKARALEESNTQLVAENLELRKKLDSKVGNRMCTSSSADSDSDSDSTCTSSSSSIFTSPQQPEYASSNQLSPVNGIEQMESESDEYPIQPIFNGSIISNGYHNHLEEDNNAPPMSPPIAT